ncbi:MAG: LLM class flavin-dependent oxidoreductase [Acidimicrobiales bacterium]
MPGEVLATEARQIESLGLAGIFMPEIYSDPFMGLGFCAAVTDRVQLATGIKIAFASNPFEIAMTAMDLDRVSGGAVRSRVGNLDQGLGRGISRCARLRQAHRAHQGDHRGDPVAGVWDVADSFCLCPPIGGLPPEQVAFYLGGIAETFYG